MGDKGQAVEDRIFEKLKAILDAPIPSKMGKEIKEVGSK